MSQIKLPKKFMQGILWDEHDEATIVSDEIVDNSRWSIIHDLTFKYNDKFYNTSYSVGATEQQDESPWEYEDEVVCHEVTPVEKTVIVYERVK